MRNLLHHGWLPILLLFFAALTHADTRPRPNIILILTDDQDRLLGSLDHMPKLHHHLALQGTSFSNHYGTVALCCPARATLFRGQASHNTNLTHVGGPGGGYHKFVASGEMESYLPKWLGEAGYLTGYLGKFMNGYGVHAQVPKYWTVVDALVTPWIYTFNHVVMRRNTQKPVFHEGWHQTDVLRLKALELIEEFTGERGQGRPFFLEVAPAAPHVRPGGFPTAPLKRHKELFPRMGAPRTPNWNPHDAVHVGKPAWVNELPQMNESVIEVVDASMRARMQGLQGVDEMVEDVVALLEKKGILDNTYIIYTTDNGFHLGQHRVTGGKGLPYIEDVNLPFIVRGPGIPAGKHSSTPQTHVDIAPTILDIAGVSKEQWPVFFDGRSLLPEWQNAEDEVPDDGIEREVINVEYWGSGTAPAGEYTTHHRDNSYKSLRLVSQHGKHGWLFNRWCTSDQTELYDTVADPFELKNLALNPDSETKRLMDRLSGLLLVTKSCGQESCRKPWEVLSSAYSNRDVCAPQPQGDGQQPIIQPHAFTSLHQAMHPKYDDFFASLPRFSFRECLQYQLADNEGPFFPPESEDLGRRYRVNTDHFYFYLPNSTMVIAEAEMEEPLYGDWEQRFASILDLYQSTRQLTGEEIGWETELCSAPEYCNLGES